MTSLLRRLRGMLGMGITWAVGWAIIMFILANIIMIPLGIIMIRVASRVLRAPRSAIMPVIVLMCAVGTFATGNNLFAVLTVAAFGVIGYVMERNGYPHASSMAGSVTKSCSTRLAPGSTKKSRAASKPFRPFERFMDTTGRERWSHATQSHHPRGRGVVRHPRSGTARAFHRA